MFGLEVELAAGVAVYLASPQAKFLSGRYMSANWDVDELEARKDEITERNLLKINLTGEFGSVVTTMPTSTTILYPAEEGARFDMDYFLGRHMPLVMKHWQQYGLEGYEVTQFHAISGQKPQYSVQCILKWDKPESMEKATQGLEAKDVYVQLSSSHITRLRTF